MEVFSACRAQEGHWEIIVFILLQMFGNNPQISIRHVSEIMDIPRSIIGRMTRMKGLHPYHFKRVQHLTEADFLPRIEFCQWILANENTIPRILWSDDSIFTRNGAFNLHNMHHWSDENPKVVHRTNFQHRFSLNLWAGVIGPIVLPHRLNSEVYLNFLQNELMDIIPLDVRQQFQGILCLNLNTFRKY
ncbi:unnamed protein product [Acanthoscelides obtectus]|uniref:Transposase n=1 Tax=Acanthoscelides obtectus TaxID=200917 RepID=A0A9P0PFN7_ACAOB|nr:unnamed protein product [Acanthoscelides obtectus]CAK1672086.1 hypothetical protein AOBTE_LOCUS28638 [Acanthoscelides obtectus]